MKSLLAALFFLLSFSGGYAQDIKDDATGVTFPSEIAFSMDGRNYQLQTTGVSHLKMLGLKIYGMSHYLQKEAFSAQDPYQQIFQDNFAKQITLKYLMGASVSQVQNGIKKAFKSSLDQTVHQQLQNDIDTYISFFDQPLKKGDEQIIRWAPQGHVQLIINGNEIGNINNPLFAQAVWNLWFGPTSDVDRGQLVSFLNPGV